MDITELKEMNITKLVAIAKDLNVPGATGIRKQELIFKILEEAGLPPGVVNFLPGPGSVLGPALLDHPELAGVHFTGSTYVFSTIWLTIVRAPKSSSTRAYRPRSTSMQLARQCGVRTGTSSARCW